MRVGKSAPFRGEPVDVRRPHFGRAVAAQVAIAEVVGKDEYHVGAQLRFAETGNLKLET